jgi:hypothetical protein
VEIFKINQQIMETKPILKKISYALWGIGAVLVLLILISWIAGIKYPDWFDSLISNLLLGGLGIILLVRAWQMRSSDRTFASAYLILGAGLIVVALLSFTFVKIIAVAGLAVYLLTNRRVKNIINKKDDTTNQ